MKYAQLIYELKNLADKATQAGLHPQFVVMAMLSVSQFELHSLPRKRAKEVLQAFNTVEAASGDQTPRYRL